MTELRVSVQRIDKFLSMPEPPPAVHTRPITDDSSTRGMTPGAVRLGGADYDWSRNLADIWPQVGVIMQRGLCRMVLSAGHEAIAVLERINCIVAFSVMGAPAAVVTALLCASDWCVACASTALCFARLLPGFLAAALI